VDVDADPFAPFASWTLVSWSVCWIASIWARVNFSETRYGSRDRLPVLPVNADRLARTRLIGASMLVLAAALAAFVVVITVRYRDGLEQRLRTDLASAASALREVRTPAGLKSVIASLAGESISVDFAGVTGRGGNLRATPEGALLTRVG